MFTYIQFQTENWPVSSYLAILPLRLRSYNYPAMHIRFIVIGGCALGKPVHADGYAHLVDQRAIGVRIRHNELGDIRPVNTMRFALVKNSIPVEITKDRIIALAGGRGHRAVDHLPGAGFVGQRLDRAAIQLCNGHIALELR